jgi:hypothetical protein
LLAPAAAAFAMYAAVRVSPRYVGVFFVMFWTAVFLAVRLPNTRACARLLEAVAASILVMTIFSAMPETYRVASALKYDVPADQSWQWKIADGLHRAGLRPGDKVAVIGYAPSAYWARLAQVRIVAEAFSEELDFLSVEHIDEMLLPGGALRPEVEQALAGTGARAVVARNVPASVVRHGWQDLDIRPWSVYRLPQ